MVCCKAGVDGRYVYMVSPTSLLVYDEGGSDVRKCVRFVSLGYDGLFSADVRRFQRRGVSRVDVPLPFL